MGGVATFSGTTYQARVLAVISSHLLAEWRLAWGDINDVPTRADPEVGGVGDDIRIYNASLPPTEAQAKHGLNRSQLREILARLAANPEARVALIIDTSSTANIRTELRNDLDRIRSGRTDFLQPVTKELAAETVGDLETLRRLSIVVLDVDSPSDSGTLFALSALASVLADETQKVAAWAVLTDLADDATKSRFAVTRDLITQRLKAAGIGLRPRRPNDAWHARLEFTKRLLEDHHSEAVLAELSRLRRDIEMSEAEPRVWYLLRVQRSNALRQLGRYPEALAAAREALDGAPEGPEALRAAFYAALTSNEVELARSYLERVRHIRPEDPKTWGAGLYLARVTGSTTTPTPPEAVANDQDYITVEAESALFRDEFSAARSLALKALAAGPRSPYALLILAQATLSLVGATSTDREDLLNEVEQTATEILGVLSSDRHPLTPTTLALRSEARNRLGRHAEASLDIDRLNSLNPDDLNGIRQKARFLGSEARFEEMLAVLLRPVVDDSCDLLGLRARVYFELGREDAARRDLDSAERLLADAIEPTLARAQIGEVALSLGDVQRAERLMSELTTLAPETGPVLLLEARLLAHGLRYDEAAAIYHKAAGIDPHLAAELLGELGYAANRWRRYDLALRAFEGIGAKDERQEHTPGLARALVETGQLPRAKALLDRLGTGGSMPTWAIALAVEIAAKQEDTENQVRALEELVRRPGDHRNARLHLVRGLLEVGRTEEATSHLDALLAQPQLSAVERMQAAMFLHQLGTDEDRAIKEAYAAFRLDPDDPAVNRGLVATVLTSRGSPRTVETVEAEAFVELTTSTGDRRVHRVLAAGPYNRMNQECSPAEAERMGLLGKRVGDELEPSQIGAAPWRVSAIAPVEVEAANAAATAYETRFPSEPFFFKGFRVGDLSTIRDLAPIISSLEQRRAFVERAFNIQAQNGLPLAALAKMIGTSVADLLYRQDTPPANRPVQVEWNNAEDQRDVRRTLATRRQLILTRSALHTSAVVDLFEPLSQSHDLIAPRTLQLELEAELRKAESEARDGASTMMSGQTGLTLDEIPPGHPALVRKAAFISSQRDFLMASVTLMPRPLEVVAKDTDESIRLREMLGAAAFDAIRLTEHTDGVLYADDLGLRRLNTEGRRLLSCSSVTLVASLAEKGALSADRRDRALADLAGRGYSTIFPTVELLGFAVSHPGEVDPKVVTAVLSTLANETLTLADVAWLVVELVRTQSLSPVIVASTHEIVSRCLSLLLANSWPRDLLLRAVLMHARERLQFLPTALTELGQACREFLERR